MNIESLIIIFTYLPYYDLLNIALSNKYFNNIINDDYFWKQYVIKNNLLNIITKFKKIYFTYKNSFKMYIICKNLNKYNLSKNYTDIIYLTDFNIYSFQKVYYIPKYIKELKLIESIDIYNNNLINIDNIFELNLKKIMLSYNQITTIPIQIKNFKNLRFLTINNNQIKKIPNEFCLLENLSILNLSHNKIKYLPSSFKKLNKLEILYISFNLLSKFPKSFKYLNNLIKLDISYNRITKIPNISSLSNLSNLDLRNSKIIKINKHINDLHNLRYLILNINMKPFNILNNTNIIYYIN